MKAKKFADCVPNLVALASGGCVSLIIVLIMNKDYPLVGHDYRFFIPRLIDTSLHIRLNGPVIQWYTPSFGGGLPAFANPQHIEYSIIQGLACFMNPWLATLLSTAIISFVGYFFFYKFLHQTLELDWMPSVLGAVFFIGNGFYIEHMIVGHVGFQLFPLSSVLLYNLINPQGNKVFYRGVTIALLVTLIIHQAGFIISIIIALSLCITLPALYLHRHQVLDAKQIILVCVLALLLATAMTGSKLHAVSALMQHFPRKVSDFYNVSLLQGLIGVSAQLFGVMTFTPILVMTGIDPEQLLTAFSTLTGTNYGIWELDTGLSPVLLVFLLSALLRLATNIRKNGMMKLKHSQIWAMLILLVTIWVTLEMVLAKGLIYSFTKELPILDSLHVNPRFTAAFVLPLAVIGAIEADRLFAKEHGLLYFLTGILLSMGFLFSYFAFPGYVYWKTLDLRPTNETYGQIQNHNTFPINRIADRSDDTVFLEYASSYKPYEGIFGYRYETFTPQTHPGSILEEENGYFNMTNPASLVFPEINNLHLFERIKVSERDKLEIFLARGQPEWKIPFAQKFLNVLSLIALVFTIGVLLAAGAIRIKVTIRDGT